MKSRLIRLALAGLLAAGVFAACKKYPTEPEHPLPVVVEGGYQGFAELGSARSNLRLEIAEVDSVSYTGNWRFGGAAGDLENVYTDSGQDTVWFAFRYAGTLYRAQSLIEDVGLVVHILEPPNVSDFRANRDWGGYNLTGGWTGRVSSSAWQASNDAVFSMDQRGALYAGGISTSFVETYVFQLLSGSVGSGVFQLRGTLQIGGNPHSTLLSGSYSGADTISGVWSAGDQGEVDDGQFIFYRSYN